MDTKKCSRCDTEKLTSEFNRRTAAKDGLQTWCKLCLRSLSAKRRADRPEETRAYQARYRSENRDICDAATKRWRENNKERVAEQKRAWAKANPDKLREIRARNRESRAKRLSTWKAKNRDKVNEYQRRRRAAGYGGPVDLVDVAHLWESENGVCGICDSSIDRSLEWPHPMSLSVDHIVPLSRGGLHQLDNCQLAHLECNMRKGNRTN